MTTIICAGIFALLLATLSGCKPNPVETAKETAPPAAVQTVQAKRGPVSRILTLPGEVKPYQEAVIFAKVAGYLKTIPVDKGDSVKEGDLLADIEVPEMLADLQKYKAEVEVANLDFQRLSESQKKAPDLVMVQSVDEARGRLEIAKANQDRTQTLLAYAKIRAPFSGLITRRMVDPGAFIPAATGGGSPDRGALVTLTDLGRVRLQVAVPELESSFIAVGEPVHFSVDGLPGRVFDGAITRFAYSLDDSSKTMLAEIEMPNPKLALRPGMYATVKIGIERKEDALLAPVEAVLVEKSGPSVFTVADGKAKKLPVKTGFNDGTDIEVLSGVNLGQPLILVAKKPVADGQPVTPTEAK
jgi:RND family efflux transporter MFP subunit